MTRLAGSETSKRQSTGPGQFEAIDAAPNGPAFIEVYLVRNGRGRFVLFVGRRALASYAASEKDRFLRFIRRLMRSRNRVVRWVGRVSRMGHRYYQRLEDRIDPIERMVKALNFPGQLHVRHVPVPNVEDEFYSFLRWQASKHTTWIVVDGIVTAIAIMLAPILIPIPGPNVFFFFPFLRLLSHIQALRGARRAMGDDAICFSEIEGLDGLTGAGVTGGSRERTGGIAETVEGLGDFLERVG